MNNNNIPGYTIIDQLGRGGMATVYLANQNCVDRQVALKVMDPAFSSDASFGERFIREAKIIAKLSHPNIVSVIEVGVHENMYFLAMDYHSGGDLKDKIDNYLSPTTALEYIQQVAQALGHAHKKGFIHRDIKPENILFNENGNAILSDFGIARAQTNTTNMTAVGSIVGTPRYMSPEQAKGIEVDFKADLYSLGVVLYEMLTGKVPYDADTDVAIGIKHISADIPQLASINPLLAHYQPIINTLMAKQPNDRCESAERLIEHIEKVKSGKTPDIPGSPKNFGNQTVIASAPQGNKKDTTSTNNKRKNKASILAITLFLIASIIGGGLYTTYTKPIEQTQTPSAQLNFTTIPEGASVLINGTRIGSTPINNYTVKYGAHKLSIKHPHYIEISKTLDVATDISAQQHFILKRGKGAVSIFSDPENAVIFIDDTRLDTKTPYTLNDLATGNHVIRLEHKGFFTKEVSIDLQTDKVEKLVLNLKPQVDHEQFLTPQQKKIRSLLKAAALDFQDNRLTSPEENSAYNKYLKVIEISPQNQEAKNGILRIAQRYTDLAENAIIQKNHIKASNYLAIAKKINPKLKKYKEINSQLAKSINRSFSIGEKFNDRLANGSKGPEMVVIPAGSFHMGDITGKGLKNEQPVHKVTIAKNFAIGTKEVTFEEYDRFAKAMGAPLPNDSGWGRGTRPVIYVDWNYAKAYTIWLSKQTGYKYRLPSEAEWEYAARAKTETAYTWGDELVMDMANCKSCKSDRSHNKTTPTGTYKSNNFGVHDMLGNVWEWVEDCWNDTYEYAPTDGSPRLNGKCSQRVLRGGSWLNQAKSIRSASRSRDKKVSHFYFFGFRVVREL